MHSVQVHSIHSVHSILTRDQLWAQPQLPSSFCHRCRGIHIHSKDIRSGIRSSSK